MNKKRVYIFAAGTYYKEVKFTESDYVIAADGGYKYCQEHEIIPDLIIGDFDSLDGNFSFGGRIITLPKEKDITDTAAAVDYALEAGFDEFHIFGGTGGRLDHTLANIALAANLGKKRCYLYGDGVIITSVTDGKITFLSHDIGKTVSVFSFSEKSEGVTLGGLRYPLENAVLYNNFPLGVSNEIAVKEVTIEVKSGTLIVILPEDVHLL
jgi:thiamine pyrophosphokinase